LISLADKGSTKSAMETKQQGFDVLTSAEGVHRKIGAGAEVFKHTGTAHCHSILPAACRLHQVVAISPSGRLRKNVLNRLPGALLSGGDLFLDDHVGSSSKSQDSRKWEAAEWAPVEKDLPALYFSTEVRRVSSSGLLRVLIRKLKLDLRRRLGRTETRGKHAGTKN
jgi:hypothetical protein